MYLVIYLFINLINTFCALNIFGPQPRIIAQNGHLGFWAASHKNISFLTYGTGRVLINGIDLTKAAKISDNAIQAMERYQTNFESSFEKIARFEQILDGEDGLMNKILVLEQNGERNSSKYSPLLTRRLRRINRRITVLQRRLVTLENLLVKDECQSNPCKNGGTCVDLYNAFLCHCPAAWEGEVCNVDVNECSRFLGTDLGCQNGATCINRVGSYECLCIHGWFGIHCTRRSNDCSSGSGAELCGHGTCIPVNSEIGYKCICDQGWTTDGSNPACNKDVDECKTGRPPCSVNPLVECINLPGAFHCGNCPVGYTGNGFYCNDIDECQQNNGGCSSLVQCINIPGSSVCGHCPPGYEGNGKMCSYQNNLCTTNNGGCHPLATCRDNPRISSTYLQCICPPGYLGNGIGPNGCIRSPNFNIHPCNPNPCVHGTCAVSNITGEYVCTCYRRWLGQNCDVLRNLCNSNPCLNGGTCRSILGISYRCTCPSAYIGLRCENEKQACGGRLQTESGTLVYPSITSLSQEYNCAWIIETNITKVLNITFKQFNLEKTKNCQNNWLQIHDGKNTLSHSLGRFCGDELPHGGVITSTHNVIYLWFRSDRFVSDAKFELSWESVDPVCGDVITVRSHGSISSPGSPGNYPNNRDCYWILSAPTGKRILFHFFTLIIGNHTDCNHDYLTFIQGVSQLNDVFAKFCNSSHPSPLYSPGPDVLVHFHSDASENFPGFQITYSLAEGIPGCGGVFTSEQGEIRSPSFDGSYPPDLSCEYKISLPKQSRIQLKFLSFALEDSDRCRYDRVVIYDGSTIDSPLIGRYCGKTIPAPYITGSNEVLIVFRTDWATTEEGFVLQYDLVCGGKYTTPTGEVQSRGYPNTFSGTNNCIYEIMQPLGLSITLTFIDLDIKENDFSTCIYNYIEVRDGDHENSTLINKFCKKAPPFIISSYNYLWIKFHTEFSISGRGFKANYTTTQMGCGGILKEKIGTISSAKESDGYLPLQYCQWIISAPPGNVIQIVWMNFNLEDGLDCDYDYVQVFDNNTETGLGGSMGKFCGHTIPPMLLSSSNVVTLKFVTDNSINKEGFLASYTFISDSSICGANYYTSAGTLKSPDYPNNYGDNLDCIWTIHAEPGHQIMLNISDFDIESYTDCRYDFLEIRNGDKASSPLLGKFCGTDIPKLIPSHANKLFLHFKTDMTKTSKGFKIYWDSTSTGCGGTLNAPSGSIISPHYPESYPSNLECIWKISVSAGSVVQAVFSDIDLEQHSSCMIDYVELFDGSNDNSKAIGRYCTSQVPSYLTSTKNHMTVKFVSDISSEGRGFQLQYNTNCNTTATGFRGVIESPNFPNNYPHNLNCIWEIKVSDKNKINITFSHFDLEKGLLLTNDSTKGCSFDYVEISYKQNDETSEEDEFIKYGRYCGDRIPDVITVNSDHAKIQFVTDSLLLGLGFRLEWQLEGCGGILTKPSGFISSPNYPHGYPPSVNCNWQIQAEPGQSIEITFTTLDIEKEGFCHYDFIKIYNGDAETYPEITTLCYQRKPTTVVSTGNLMLITFKADASYHGRGFIANYTFKATKCGGKLNAAAGYVMSPNYPHNFDVNDTCSWLIEVDDNHVVELTFQDVDLPIRAYNSTYSEGTIIKVHDGPTAAYPVLVQLEEHQKPNKTLASSYNHMYIEMLSYTSETSKGFKAKYQKSCGAHIKTSSSGIINFSPMDVNDENAMNCTWAIVAEDPTKHVSLTLTYLDVGYSACEDGDYSIAVYGGESSESPILGKYCSNKIPPMLTSGGSAIFIVCDLYSHFSAIYSVFDSACGGSLISAEGNFASPGYPKSYPMNTECEWILSVAEGNHVTVTFETFSLLESDRCNTDYLEIRQYNNSGKLVGVFCNDDIPANITHFGSLWIYLKTSATDIDSSLITAKGFLAEYKLNTMNELVGESGIIESPLYPKSIKYYSYFSWQIMVDYSKKIMLEFLEFYLEDYDSSCIMTRLEVYDGSDDTANTLGVYCGLEIPKSLESTTNIMFIKVSYSSTRFENKFRLKWTSVSTKTNLSPDIKVRKCGIEEIIDISGRQNSTIITSPGYPFGYASNLKCEWTFSTIPMNHIYIYFDKVNLERHVVNSCYFDYIEIFQKKGVASDWESIAKVCSPNATRYDGTNLIKVVFNSNRFVNGSGFSARVKEACGGSLTDPMGYIHLHNDTPLVRSTYTYWNCQWNITVRPGRTIEVKFLEFDVEADSNNNRCINYLMLRNGQYPYSPLLGQGKYCGTEFPPPLTTTSNHLYLKYSGRLSTKGFKLQYREISFDCGGEIKLTTTDNFTEITSPNYPNIPHPHIECSWVILAPPGERFRVDFHGRFDILGSKECLKEYVDVRDGGTVYSPLIQRSCRIAPNSVYSKDNVVFIKYFTDLDEPGNGFSAKISIAKCGGTIRSPTGIIQYQHDIQSKNEIINCTWNIVVSPGNTLKLTFTVFNLDSSTSCRYGENILIKEDNKANNSVNEHGPFCGNITPQVIETISNEVSITFLSEGESLERKSQFKLSYSAVPEKCGGMLETNTGAIYVPPRNHPFRCNWIIKVEQGRRIVFDIISADVSEDVRREEGIVFFNGPKFESPIGMVEAPNIAKRIKSSENLLMIYYWSTGIHSTGFSAVYSSSEPTLCQGDFTEQSGVIRQPQNCSEPYYCTYIHNMNESTKRNKTFALSIELSINFTRKGIACTFATTYIDIIGENEKYPLIHLCQTTSNPLLILSPLPTTKLIASKTAKYSMNYTVSFETHDCGGIIDGEFGTIFSPNYPNKYSRSIGCSWLLRLPEGQQINLTVDGLFNLGTDCDKNYLEVFNGGLPAKPRIGRYCRQTSPGSIISQSNNLWINYKFDKDTGGKGFRLKYEPIINGCGGIFHDRNRVIQTPNFPKEYPNNAECSWQIESMPGYHVSLKIIGRFQLEDSENCKNDKLIVLDWKNDAWVEKGTYCGRDIPQTINSTSNKLMIRFTSNDQISGGGFRAEWSWACGGTFEADSKERFIVSPGYPNNYEGNMYCEYLITTPSSSYINLHFYEFSLEGDNTTCKFDNLTIVGSLSALRYAHHLRNIYCGTAVPPDARLNTNIYIIFQTDSYLNRPGFKFSYQTESCGGNLIQPAVIQSPTLNNHRFLGTYQGYLTCTWNITAPAKNIVVVQFEKFDMPIRHGCYFDNVEIFEDFQQRNRTANLCGNLNQQLPVIKSKSNTLAVRLRSDRTTGANGFSASIYFVPGPEQGCGGNIKLTSSYILSSPNLDAMDCTWHVIAPRDSAISISLSRIHLPGSCTDNFIDIKDGISVLAETIEKLCNMSNSDMVKKYMTSGSVVQLRFYALKNSRFEANFTIVPSVCGPSLLNSTSEPQILASPNYPNLYPDNIKCTWIIKGTQKSVLHFIDFDLTENVGNIDGNRCWRDRVQIKDGMLNQYPLDPHVDTGLIVGDFRPINEFNNYAAGSGTHQFCGKQQPFDYYTNRDIIVVTFSSSTTESNRGRGFKLEYQKIGCIRNFTSLQGRIVNNNLTDCYVTITVPSNYTVSVFFQYFMLLHSNNCNEVGVEIKDGGHSGRSILWACGYALPDPVFSTKNSIWIHTWNKRKSGFLSNYDLVYTSSDQGMGCGGTFYDSKGRLSSPLYPRAYTNDKKCIWQIQVPYAMRVSIKITDFDIQGGCDTNYLAVTTNGTNIHKFCKEDDPAMLFSDNRLTVTYQSSSINTGRGWLALFQAVSDGT